METSAKSGTCLKLPCPRSCPAHVRVKLTTGYRQNPRHRQDNVRAVVVDALHAPSTAECKVEHTSKNLQARGLHGHISKAPTPKESIHAPRRHPRHAMPPRQEKAPTPSEGTHDTRRHQRHTKAPTSYQRRKRNSELDGHTCTTHAGGSRKKQGRHFFFLCCLF